MATVVVDCPTCGKKVAWNASNKFRPFCSEKCKLIDLGAWAEETYTIAATEPENPEDDASNA